MYSEQNSLSSKFVWINHSLYIVILIINFISLPVFANEHIRLADSLYYLENYTEALSQYKIIVGNEKYFEQNFNINFKIAYCFYKSNDYAKARKVFLNLKSSNPGLIPEYIDYFLFQCAVKQNDDRFIYGLGLNYLNNYSEHFLADSIILYLADYEFTQGNYLQAYNRYSHLIQKSSSKTKKSYYSAQIAYCKYHLDGKENSLEPMYQHMKKYPSSPYALNIAMCLDSVENLPEKHFFAAAQVFLSHKKFNHLKNKLETFIKNTDDAELKERARFYLIQIYYELRQNQSALYGFENILTELKNKSLESRVYISIARCYLRLGQQEIAAEKYINYAKRFPRRRLAVEAVWKAAWIYENLGKIKESAELYDMILKRWPRSEYGNEARFRVGFSYFRLGYLSECITIFKNIAEGKYSQFHKHRGNYWLAKVYERLDKRDDAVRIYLKLGRKLFYDYYTMKSYMTYKQYFDNLFQVEEKLLSNENPLIQYKHTLASLVQKFNTVFLLQELINDEFALYELVNKKYIPNSLYEWIGFAEIYKRLNAYHSAYRVYDYINNKYFDELDYLEKPFILKEIYPLYFDHFVDYYSSIHNLEKSLIMAIIRQESAYDKDAHSWANAYGLMQIIPATANEISEEISTDYSFPNDLFDANLNIKMGTYYLKKLLKQFEHQPEYALAAYNAGPHRVMRWKKMKLSEEMDFFIENIEFSQTRDYVRRVMRNYWLYSILDSVF